MSKLFVRFLLTACCFCAVAVGLTFLLRDQLFHPVPARCLEGKWVDRGGLRRGFAFLSMQYEWQGRVYEGDRMFSPLEDSPRMREWPEDVERGRAWIAANCRDQPALVMHGLPGIAWFGDKSGWASVIVAVALRAIALAALVVVAWTFIRRAWPTTQRTRKS
jgi:hypothetical protein